MVNLREIVIIHDLKRRGLGIAAIAWRPRVTHSSRLMRATTVSTGTSAGEACLDTVALSIKRRDFGHPVVCLAGRGAGPAQREPADGLPHSAGLFLAPARNHALLEDLIQEVSRGGRRAG